MGNAEGGFFLTRGEGGGLKGGNLEADAEAGTLFVIFYYVLPCRGLFRPLGGEEPKQQGLRLKARLERLQRHPVTGGSESGGERAGPYAPLRIQSCEFSAARP